MLREILGRRLIGPARRNNRISDSQDWKEKNGSTVVPAGNLLRHCWPFVSSIHHRLGHLCSVYLPLRPLAAKKRSAKGRRQEPKVCCADLAGPTKRI